MKSARLLKLGVLFLCLASVLSVFQAAKAQDAAKYIGLAHINIQTKDLEKSIRFYEDNLHFVVTDRTESTRPDGTMKVALIRLGSCILELSQPPNPDSVVQNASGVIGHFAIEVSNIEKLVSELKAKGIKPARDVTTLDKLFGGARIAFISGPSGESIELFEFLNPDRKAAAVK